MASVASCTTLLLGVLQSASANQSDITAFTVGQAEVSKCMTSLNINVDRSTGIRGQPGKQGQAGPAGPRGEQGPPGPAGAVLACPYSQQVQAPAVNSSNWIGALSTLVAALIAGIFALVGLIIAKENKTSEFRQAWIDALRQELAEYSTSVNRAGQWERQMLEAPEKNSIEYDKILQPMLISVGNSQTKIRLRINAKDSNKKLKKMNLALLKLIDDIQEDYNKENAPEKLEEAAAKARNLHTIAAPILKYEWERVKRGERIYNVAKYVASILVATTFIAAAIFLFKIIYNGF